MARDKHKGIYNFDDAETKRRMYQLVRSLKGVYRVELKPSNGRLSDAQRAYFHGVVVQAFYEFLNDPGHGDGRDHYPFEMCKNVIVGKVLGLVDIKDPRTGALLSRDRRSSEALDKVEYSKLIDRAIEYLDKMYDVTVPPPELYYDTKAVLEEPKRRRVTVKVLAPKQLVHEQEPAAVPEAAHV